MYNVYNKKKLILVNRIRRTPGVQSSIHFISLFRQTTCVNSAIVQMLSGVPMFADKFIRVHKPSTFFCLDLLYI